MDVRNPSREGDRRAVVALTLTRPSDPSVLAIVRTPRGRHGGQIALPGGHPETVDATQWDTARRELAEETGFDGDLVRLGALGEFNTNVSRYRVDVEVACVTSPPRAWRLQADEVTALLEIPLRVLAAHHAALPEVDDVWRLPIECGFDVNPVDHLVAGEELARSRG